MKVSIEKRKFVVSVLLLLFTLLGTCLICFSEAEARTVKLFYFLPNDRTYRQEVVDAMKTGIVEISVLLCGSDGVAWTRSDDL